MKTDPATEQQGKPAINRPQRISLTIDDLRRGLTNEQRQQIALALDVDYLANATYQLGLQIDQRTQQNDSNKRTDLPTLSPSDEDKP